MTSDVKAIATALADPFDPREVKFKAQTVKGNRALAVAFIDARLVQDRLDEVVGVENWQDEYTPIGDGSMLCRLSVRFGSEWVAKTDVGSPSEQPDGGDRMKSSLSDALKRAAVKFGIGRYLYRLPASWVDYDPVKKQLTGLPQLPAFALPGQAKPAPAAARTTAPPAGEPDRGDAWEPTPAEHQPTFAALAKSRGQTWAACLTRLNTEFGTAYDPKTAFLDVTLPHRQWLVYQVAAMPAKE